VGSFLLLVPRQAGSCLGDAFAIFPHGEWEGAFKKLFCRMPGVGLIAVSARPEWAKRVLRMQRVKIHRFWRSGIRAVPGTLLVGLVTFICYGLGLNLTATGFLYLIIVVLQSLLGDFVSSAVVSIIADLCLNFFFVPPIFSFRVSDSSDIWALIAFLIIVARPCARIFNSGPAFMFDRRVMAEQMHQHAGQHRRCADEYRPTPARRSAGDIS